MNKTLVGDRPSSIRLVYFVLKWFDWMIQQFGCNMPLMLDFIIYFPQATNNNSLYLIREITDSHEIFDVVDAGGVPVLELFLSGHLYHLILLCFVEPAVAVLAVVEVSVEPELFDQNSL